MFNAKIVPKCPRGLKCGYYPLEVKSLGRKCSKRDDLPLRLASDKGMRHFDCTLILYEIHLDVSPITRINDIKKLFIGHESA